MSPTRRSRKNSDLTGTNIKAIHRKKGKPDAHYDYYYIMPNGKTEFLSKNRAEAIEAAIALNQSLRPSGTIVDRVTGYEEKKKNLRLTLDNVPKVVSEFITDFMPEKNYAKTTYDEKIRTLKLIAEYWEDTGISKIETRDIVNYLKPLTVNNYIKHRVTLNDLFQFSIHSAYCDSNPVTPTMKKSSPKRKRKKHTLEGWNQVRSAAPDWLKRAMDIALLTLQRRSDLTGIHKKEHIDIEARTIRILQDKTRNYAQPVYIEIKMGVDLYNAVKACYQTDIICPYLIHYRPIKMPPADKRESKLHPFSVTNEHLSKSFAKARDESGAYDDIPKGIRPSFHDARGLGAWLYEKAGFDKKYIQLLTGHCSEEMLNEYISGHEEVKPVRVNADLALKTSILESK